MKRISQRRPNIQHPLMLGSRLRVHEKGGTTATASADIHHHDHRYQRATVIMTMTSDDDENKGRQQDDRLDDNDIPSENPGTEIAHVTKLSTLFTLEIHNPITKKPLGPLVLKVSCLNGSSDRNWHWTSSGLTYCLKSQPSPSALVKKEPKTSAPNLVQTLHVFVLLQSSLFPQTRRVLLSSSVSKNALKAGCFLCLSLYHDSSNRELRFTFRARSSKQVYGVLFLPSLHGKQF